MRGIIEAVDGHAKMEIWVDAWMVGKNIDGGGGCKICEKGFDKVKDLIAHFLVIHDRKRYLDYSNKILKSRNNR